VRIRTFRGGVGVEIENLVLRRAGKAQLAELRKALVGAGLVILRRQSLTDEELQVAAAGLSSAVGARGPAVGDIAHVSNLTDERGRPLGEEDYAARDWASDFGTEPERRFRLLHAIETPASGGSLHFCDLQSAIPALTENVRRAAEAVRIERKPPPSLLRRIFGAGLGPAPTPMIYDAPDGAPRLRLPGAGDRIAGMEPDAASAVVADVLEELTVKAHCAVHDWGPGDVLIWERERFLRRREASTGVYLMKSLCFT